MSEQAGEIEVILDDRPVETEVVLDEPAKVEDKPAKKILGPEEGLEKLKEQLENERKEREQAEQRARESDQRALEARQRESAARTEVQDTNLSLVTNAIESVKQNQGTLKDRMKAALTEQDYDTVADIQLQMSDNSAKMMELEKGKVQLEERAKEKPEPIRHADPVEAFASQLSPRSASWVRSHPECVRDKALFGKMLAADNWARANGHTADSDSYFESVETMLGIRKSEDGGDDAPQRRAAPSAAPPSRQAPNGTSQNRRIVRLTPDQIEAAENSGMTHAEYAQNLEALRSEGRIQ